METKIKEYLAVITDIQPLTHEVNRYRITKPAGYSYEPGQATDVAINTAKWRNEKRPFTFTGLNEGTELELIIKRYDQHNGMTRQLAQLKPGDQLLIGDPWGAISYKGPGTFIAGGAGITPFIAILRHLRKENKLSGNRLLFSNKTRKDIILEEELRYLLGDDLVLTLSDEKNGLYEHGHMDFDFLKRHSPDLSCHFYVCGPPGMMNAVGTALNKLGVN
jgi:ferredoxin-NADP reductase